MRAHDEERPLWYVAYGSNLARDRFRAYLEGGSFAGREHRGARDPRPPVDERAVVIPHALYFASHSVGWGSSVAFVDAAAGSGSAHARAYLLRWRQVEDILTQENGETAVLEIDELPETRTFVTFTTSGKYNALVRLDDIAGTPAVTITTARDLAHGRPTGAYLAVVERGLADLGALDGHAVERYLRGAGC